MKARRAVSRKAAKRKPSPSSNINQGLRHFLSTETELIAIVSLAVIVFIVYANSLGNEFVFDDIYLVQVNQQRLSSINLNLLLSSYRALRDLSYAVDYAIWGEGPFGFHLTNLLLHALNSLLVFTLIRRLTEDVPSAFVAALIFAVHPIQTDAVTYISGRRDLLFSLFYLAAFHSYISYYRSRIALRWALWLTAFVLLWALSLLSKEMAVSLPVLIFVWHYCNAWEETKPRWRGILRTAGKTIARDKWFWLVFSLMVVAFTFYAVLFAGASARARNLEYWGGSFYSNLLTVVRVHAWYLKQLIYPTPIAQYLGVFEPSQSLLDWRFLLSLLPVAAVVVGGFLLLRRQRLMAFAILSYFVLLLPVSQIIPHHELLADHYLYLPMMSFGLFVSLLVGKIRGTSPTARKVIYPALAVVILALAAMTIVQNRTWKNERTLWTANYKAVPNSPRAALNLGNTYQDTDPQRAETLFKRALALNPSAQLKQTLHDRLVVVLIAQQKFDEAEFFVREVLAQSPEDFFGNLWSGQIHLFKKECSRAREELSRAQSVAHNPREVSLAEETQRQFQQQCGN